MAYNSTSWTTDSLTKATNSTSTNDSLNISGTLTVAGASQLNSTLTIGVDDTGYDAKFFGATSGRYMLWDESEDALTFQDNTQIKFGNGNDMSLYHDGSHNYIFSSTVELRIGTTASCAISIGNSTSETTINDNLNITGSTIATRASVTNLADDGSIPITSTCVNIDANGSARTGIRFAGAGTAGQILIVTNTGAEALTFHNTVGTALLRGVLADHDTIERNFTGLFISDGTYWNYIGGGDSSAPDTGLTAS